MAFTPEEISQILEEFFKTVGTRQYIGARYVPIFGRKDEQSIEWDGGLAPYEPLTIVLYQGNSYTSRQFVPAGVQITNEAFWALTGNYNGQIEQYRQEVQNAIETTANVQNDIDTLLPKSSFSSSNTVKDYVDSQTSNAISQMLANNTRMLDTQMYGCFAGGEYYRTSASCLIDDEHMIVAVIGSDNAIGELRMINLTTGNITTVYTGYIGHCNDMEFIEGRIYIAGAGVNETYGTTAQSLIAFEVINYNVYFDEIIEIQSDAVINAIGLDKQTGKVYVGSPRSSAIYELDMVNFTLTETGLGLEITPFAYGNISGGQGFTIVDGVIHYLLYSGSRIDFILLYDVRHITYNGYVVFSRYESTGNFIGEAEGIVSTSTGRVFITSGFTQMDTQTEHEWICYILNPVLAKNPVIRQTVSDTMYFSKESSVKNTIFQFGSQSQPYYSTLIISRREWEPGLVHLIEIVGSEQFDLLKLQGIKRHLTIHISAPIGQIYVRNCSSIIFTGTLLFSGTNLQEIRSNKAALTVYRSGVVSWYNMTVRGDEYTSALFAEYATIICCGSSSSSGGANCRVIKTANNQLLSIFSTYYTFASGSSYAKITAELSS